ncbi:mucin-21-like [Cherax quadricarinatus]|uniref:mucin-21-like n=1 Tax=Cherax quadricarinatus TaxID=27406 RepID=UPI00387E3237
MARHFGQKATDRFTSEHNALAKKSKVELGCKVMLLNPAQTPGMHKLVPKFVGPYRVLRQLRGNKLEVREIATGTIKEAHLDHMKYVDHVQAEAELESRALQSHNQINARDNPSTSSPTSTVTEDSPFSITEKLKFLFIELHIVLSGPFENFVDVHLESPSVFNGCHCHGNSGVIRKGSHVAMAYISVFVRYKVFTTPALIKMKAIIVFVTAAVVLAAAYPQTGSFFTAPSSNTQAVGSITRLSTQSTSGNTSPSSQSTSGNTTPSFQSTSGNTSPSSQSTSGNTSPSSQSTSGNTSPSSQSTSNNTKPSSQPAGNNTKPTPQSTGNNTKPTPQSTGNNSKPSPQSTGNDTKPTPQSTGNNTKPTPQSTGNNTKPSPQSTGNDTKPTPQSTGNNTKPTPQSTGNSTKPTPQSTGNNTKPTPQPTGNNTKPTPQPTGNNTKPTPQPTGNNTKPTPQSTGNSTKPTTQSTGNNTKPTPQSTGNNTKPTPQSTGNNTQSTPQSTGNSTRAVTPQSPSDCIQKLCNNVTTCKQCVGNLTLSQSVINDCVTLPACNSTTITCLGKANVKAPSCFQTTG